MNKERVVNKAEELADQFLRLSKHWLPHLARLCIVSTFIEDGFRMWMQWGSQRDYMSNSWNVHWVFGTAFVCFNMFAQLGGAAVVLCRRHVNVGVGILFTSVILQTLAYEIFTELRFLMKNLALVGGLVLLIAEEKAHGKSLFAGLPSMGEGSSKTYLQLGGRLMLVLMFLTLLRFNVSFFSIVINVIGGGLALLLAIGYKTKLASLALVCLLTTLNFYFNNWWNYYQHVSMRDFLKYDFFQMLSVIGGLLLVISLGPGGYSVDEHKKRW